MGGLAALLAFLALTAAVVHGGLDGIDREARTLVHQARHPGLLSAMRSVSDLGGSPGQAALVVLACGLLWRRQRCWAVALPFVMAGAGVVQLLAKWAIARPRPNLDLWGYPSAHALSLVVLAGYLAYVGLSCGRPARGRLLGPGIAAGAVATVAFSRVYVDAHWLSDVAGGITSGSAYLLLALGLVRAVSTRWGRLAGALAPVEPPGLRPATADRALSTAASPPS